MWERLFPQGVPVLLGHNITGLITLINSLKSRLLSVYYTPTPFVMSDVHKFPEGK